MNILTKKAIALLEKPLLKAGTVLAVRAWEPATFFEIDLHLPDTDMSNWQAVQHMKCKVAEATYRDYTPARWDAATRTCTLYIDTAHDGPGSAWAAALTQGASIHHMGIASAHHKPIPDHTLLCLGDSSSLGHFLALQQLAGANAALTGAITFTSRAHTHLFKEYFTLPLIAIEATAKGQIALLSQWLEAQTFTKNTTAYITGHIPTAVELRRQLRQRKDMGGSIKVNGFWS